MASDFTDYGRILDCIPVENTDRSEWVKVGMALKYEGQPFALFDEWSSRDPRPGQYAGSEATERVWESFRCESSGIVTGATLTQMARDYGNDPFPKHFTAGDEDMDLNAMINDEPMPGVPRPGAIHTSKKLLISGSQKKPFLQTIAFLEAVFQPDDLVNIVTNTFQDADGKWKPCGVGLINFTRDRWIGELLKFGDSPEPFRPAINQYEAQAGVWVRINPLYSNLPEDTRGISNNNISVFRNALIECDTLPVEEQLEKIKELRLPYAAITHSGGKSLHVIVPVNARSLAEYQTKVEWLYEYCTRGGLPVDRQNKNPSRLSRIPGVQRGEHQQYLVDANPYPTSFDEWKREAIAEKEADKLVVQNMKDMYRQGLPPLRPEIIAGILRRGHKMLISGKSKAAKSFALIQLAIACAEGKKWLGEYQVEPGRALYLNFEIDEPSFFKRIDDVYHAMGLDPMAPESHVDQLDILNLRGQAEPLDRLVEKLKYKIRSDKYDMVIIDPIYKVITGDENSASDMAAFCSLMDVIAESGHCAVIYAHHHSKGSQAGKNAIDRSSGSGVFARDPDAICDMTQLTILDGDRDKLANALLGELEKPLLAHLGIVCTDDAIENRRRLEANLQKFYPDDLTDYQKKRDEVAELAKCDGFRINFTLREFAQPADKNVLWRWPVHHADTSGFLATLKLEGEVPTVESLQRQKEKKTEQRRNAKRDWIDSQTLPVRISDMAGAMDCAEKTIRRWVKDQEDLAITGGMIVEAASDN